MEISLISSEARGKGVLVDAVNTNDRISKLPQHILLKIVSSLSTKEVVRTCVLSKRWKDVWKETSVLFVDMRYITESRCLLIDDSLYAAGWMTKVINDHCGHFERFTIYHYPYQCEDGMVEAWIRSLVHVKHVKHLTLINFYGRFIAKTKSSITLDLPPQSFSHPNLKSLYLGRYNLKDPHAFQNCWNLKNLKLIGVVLAEVEVFNVVLLSCPFLEVLVLKLINCHERRGPLKIENSNLKFLYLSSCQIDGIEVATPSLEILTVESLSFEIDKFVIANPRLQFYRNYWTTGQLYPHTSYYIACPPQNTNAPKKEVGSSTGRTRREFWEETKPFPNCYFRAYTVWLFNFSCSKEEFALASRLIMHGTVVRTLKIKMSSISLSNKSEIEEAVTKLKELPKGHKELSIIMF